MHEQNFTPNRITYRRILLQRRYGIGGDFIGEKGLRVPDDISIIGYDNIHASRFYSPPLTTIHQSKSRLGVQAVNLLFERINHKSEQRETIEIHPELVIVNQ